MRILVVGAGAIGGYFGGRLLQAGRDVTFLVRPARADALARHGLSIRSPYGNAHLAAPPTVTAENLRPPFDLVIVGCKAQDLAASMDSFAPAVGSQTAILPTLNGMRHMDDLAARFGREHLLGGECMISVSRDAEGHIVHLNDLHRLSLGELDGASTSRIDRIYSTLSNAGFETRFSKTIQQDMWDKWIFIATAAGMTCLMRASIGDIVAAGAANLTLRFRDECAGIAAGEGFRLSSETLDKIARMMTQAGSPFTASMLRDIEAHAPLEADHVIGDLLRRADKHGLSTPLLEVAHAHLKAYEARRSRERTAS